MPYLNHRMSLLVTFWVLLKSRFANRLCLHCRLKEQTSELQCPLRDSQPGSAANPTCQPSVPEKESKEQCCCTRRAVFCTHLVGDKENMVHGEIHTWGWRSDTSVTIRSHHYPKGLFLKLSPLHPSIELAHLTSPPNNSDMGLQHKQCKPLASLWGSPGKAGSASWDGSESTLERYCA